MLSVFVLESSLLQLSGIVPMAPSSVDSKVPPVHTPDANMPGRYTSVASGKLFSCRSRNVARGHTLPAGSFVSFRYLGPAGSALFPTAIFGSSDGNPPPVAAGLCNETFTTSVGILAPFSKLGLPVGRWWFPLLMWSLPWRFSMSVGLRAIFVFLLSGPPYHVFSTVGQLKRVGVSIRASGHSQFRFVSSRCSGWLTGHRYFVRLCSGALHLSRGRSSRVTSPLHGRSWHKRDDLWSYGIRVAFVPF